MLPPDTPFPEVTVYTKPNCQPCRATTRALTHAGISFSVVDLTADDDGRQMALDLGYTSAPVVVAGDEHWSGFRPERLAALIREWEPWLNDVAADHFDDRVEDLREFGRSA